MARDPARREGTEMPFRSKLDPGEVRQYHEQGYVVLGPLLTGEEIVRLRAEEERFRLPVGYGAARNQNLRVNIQLCHRSEPIRRFCTQGPHIPLLQQLAGPDLCLTHQQFVTKLADEGDERSDIPWHQDNGYGRLEPMTDLTVWVPLVDTDLRNGCLRVIPGSHRQGLLEHDAAGVNPVLREVAGATGEGVPLVLAAGWGVAFSGLTLHASGPNRSGRTRPAFYVRYCHPETTMVGEERRPVLEDPHSWMVCGEAGR
jgi:ectoine hydroxylase-related dioxygenase (phytanoyl-CoA dioxygenase family)